MACFSSSSANSTRFFLKAATRRVLKSTSSVDQTGRLKQTNKQTIYFLFGSEHKHPYLAWPSRRSSQTFGSRAAGWSRPAGRLGSWPGTCPELCWRSRSPPVSDCGGTAGPGWGEEGAAELYTNNRKQKSKIDIFLGRSQI